MNTKRISRLAAMISLLTGALVLLPSQPAAGEATVSGMVTDAAGKPAAGVSVQIVGNYGPHNGGVKTDENGKYELTWNPQQFAGQADMSYCLFARDADHDLAVAEDLDEAPTHLDLKLAPALTLYGRVESGGQPVTNVNAMVIFWTGNRGMWLQGLARTNTPGQYEIPALPPGRKYGIVISGPGFGQKQNHNLEIFSNPGRQQLDPIELKPANLTLAGQVVDADDQPVADCYVSMYGDDQPSGNKKTDEHGRFFFEHACDGPVHLSANSQQAYGNVTAEGGDTNVVLRLGENMGSAGTSLHKLHGQVTDSNGQPAAGVSVAVLPNNGNRWVKTDTNGEYKLSWSVQPWQLQNGVHLAARDTAHDQARTEELPEDATSLNIKLKPALAVSGQVKNSEGQVLASGQIMLWIKSGNGYEFLDNQSTVPVNAEGRFEITCLPPDASYMISASAKGYGKHQQQISPEYETNRIDLGAFALEVADRVIAGQVLKSDDQPAAGVNVQLNGQGQPDGYMTTDKSGRFHFQVCAGEINLFAYSQFGGGNAQATVQAGDTNIVLNLTSNGGFGEPARRTSLKDKPLPDLSTVNLAADAVPAGRPILLCLFDAAQRPSRHVLGQLNEQAAALQQKSIAVIGVQATVISDDTFKAWKDGSSITIPLGRVTAKSDKTRWATSTSALPWLVLTDANHKVVAEGFSLDELDSQVQKIAK